MNLEAIQAQSQALLSQAGVPLPWYALPILVLALFFMLTVGVTLAAIKAQRNKALPKKFQNAAGRKALITARQAEKAGKKSDAAQAYVQCGLIDKAVLLYVQDGKLNKAADVLIAAGRVADAANQYKQAGKWDQAGRLYRQSGDLAKAAEAFDAGHMFKEAAEAWEAVGKWETAGDRYFSVNDHANAARVYERAGAWQKFVAAVVPWWEAELEQQLGRLEPQSLWLPLLDKAANEAERLGQWPAALKLGAYQGRWHTAAHAAEALGRYEEAKRFFSMANDLEGVARTAEQIGSTAEAYSARGETAEKQGRLDVAAEYFEKAGQPERALGLWQKIQRWSEVARVAESLQQIEVAATAYAAAGQPQKVGELYVQLQRWEEAGKAFEAANDLERAAEVYRKGALFLAASRLDEALGRTQAAIQDLQQHLRRVGQDREATVKLVGLMLAAGMRSTALGLLEPLVVARPLNDTDAEIMYLHGTVLEDEGRYAEAAKTYERLLAYDVAYRDARQRAERCRALPDQQAISGTSSGPGGGATPVAFQQQRTTNLTPPTNSGLPPGFDSPAPVAPTPSGGETQKILDRYQPLGELGRGGMGVVVKAHDKMLDRLVAIKLVKTPGVASGQLDKILNEARATAKLNHPNIVQIYDCALAQGNFMMAMEYVEGQTVKDLIEKEGKLPITAIVLIFGQIAKALQFAHDHGIVHRDIKPANVLWTDDKRVKITDFGLARAAQELANTQTVVVGSPYYMAPEQLMGNLMDHRVDIYALGVSMYEAATGELPFPKGDVGYHHVHTPPPDPRRLRPDLPAALAKLILDMMAKEPGARPQDCGVVLARLRAAIQK